MTDQRASADRRPSAPLILTADLPPDLHHWATALRTEHFPPERNYLEAHVTLFHALPSPYEAQIDRLLIRMARHQPHTPARIAGLLDLGGGTAIRVRSEEMLALRGMIQDRMLELLTQQDRQGKRLHITIQNKVSSSDAKALQARLNDKIEPRNFWFPSMTLHRYLDGPWERVKTYAFRG